MTETPLTSTSDALDELLLFPLSSLYSVIVSWVPQSALPDRHVQDPTMLSPVEFRNFKAVFEYNARLHDSRAVGKDTVEQNADQGD